ncbi:ATP-binding protein [Caulobacter sp.]|uniref:PAS domain-containing hybrid sensor histidine kinase/response regulator n=1 Tax=Caulobacter sp. TaxID=78 RepID=UPI003BAC0893
MSLRSDIEGPVPGRVDRDHDAASDLANFFEVSLDLLCIRDMALKFTRVNRTWESVLGYSIADLEGGEMLPLVHPDDREATIEHMRRMESEDEVRGYINRYRHRDGHYRHLEWRARRVGDKVFGVARDVTERLVVEAEIAAAKRAAEAANEAKTDFLANISHEIRTPLNGVIGVAAALAQTPLTPAQREMVDLIQSSGVTLERLVSDVLDVSKIEAGQVQLEEQAFDLRDELDGVLYINRLRALGKGLVFEVEYEDRASGDFLGDITRIKQVFGNLLANAVKFTSQGHVLVRIGLTQPDQPDAPFWLTAEVEDTGCGFSPAFGETLFNRFSQADTSITRRFGGTGLGLSICKSLVEMMGGQINARSELGRGSLFQVLLPLRPAERTAAPEAAMAALGPSVEDQPALRVLLAEDHPVNQRVVQLILEPQGARVLTVENGVQAVEAFTSGVFDLVLMDMQMPVMDGLAATRAIRDHEAARPDRARTPVIMLSANAMAQHRQDALDAGADAHMSKPVTAASLILGINDVL